MQFSEFTHRTYKRSTGVKNFSAVISSANRRYLYKKHAMVGVLYFNLLKNAV